MFHWPKQHGGCFVTGKSFRDVLLLRKQYSTRPIWVLFATVV